MYVEHICKIILYSCTLLKIKDLLCNSFNILISLLFMYVNYFIYIYLEVNIYIQSTRITLPLWTFAHSCVALTSNLRRFLAPFGLLPCLPQLQRPIHHGFFLILDFCLLPRHLKVQSNTHPIHHASKPRLPSHKLPTTQKSNTSTSVPALLYIF